MACTTFASTNTTDLSYVLETDCGITPDDAAFQLLPTTGGGPTGNITTATSEVIRSDRMTDDLVVVDSDVSGTVNYELSYEAYKPIIESLLRDTVGGDTVSTTADTWAYDSTTGEVTGTGTSFTVDYKVGYFIRVSGSATTEANGIFKIVSITDATTMNIGIDATTTYAATSADIVTDAIVHRNGTQAAKSYTILKRINNEGTLNYFYNRGCQFSQMSFNFESGSILKGTFDVVGLTEDATGTQYSGGTPTYDDVASYTLMNGVSSVSAIDFREIGGAANATEFSNIGLSINNNLNPAKAIGTLGAAAIAPFTLEITADSTVYFEDTTVYNQYLNATAFYLDITLVDGDGNNIVISLPKVKFSELAVPVDGRDSFLMQSGSLTALRDATITDESYMVQISFMPAV